VTIGNLIHEIQGTNIYSLSPQEISGLILGAPSTYVTLKLSDGKNSRATSDSAVATLYARIRGGEAFSVEEDLKSGVLQVALRKSRLTPKSTTAMDIYICIYIYMYINIYIYIYINIYI